MWILTCGEDNDWDDHENPALEDILTSIHRLNNHNYYGMELRQGPLFIGVAGGYLGKFVAVSVGNLDTDNQFILICDTHHHLNEEFLPMICGYQRVDHPHEQFVTKATAIQVVLEVYRTREIPQHYTWKAV